MLVPLLASWCSFLCLRLGARSLKRFLPFLHQKIFHEIDQHIDKGAYFPGFGVFDKLKVVIRHIVDHHIHWDHNDKRIVCGKEVVMEEHIGRLRDDDITDMLFEEGMEDEREEVILEDAVRDACNKSLIDHHGYPWLRHDIDIEGHIAVKEESK